MNISRSFLSAIVLALAVTGLHDATAEPVSRAHHALLIGIQDYAGSDLNPLDDPVNDVALVDELLESRFEVPAEHITTLTDARTAAIRLMLYSTRLGTATRGTPL